MEAMSLAIFITAIPLGLSLFYKINEDVFPSNVYLNYAKDVTKLERLVQNGDQEKVEMVTEIFNQKHKPLGVYLQTQVALNAGNIPDVKKFCLYGIDYEKTSFKAQPETVSKINEICSR